MNTKTLPAGDIRIPGWPTPLVNAICPTPCRSSCRARCPMGAMVSSRCIAGCCSPCASSASIPISRFQEMRPRRRRRDGQVSSPRRPRRSTTRMVRIGAGLSRCAIRWSRGRATSATSTAITPPPCVTPRRGMTAVRDSRMLEGIDRGRGRFPRQLRRRPRSEPVVLPASRAQFAGQRRVGHRGRHGDQHSAP